MFEVFDARTAQTVRFVTTEERAKAAVANVPSWDYAKAPAGFYVVDMNDFVSNMYDDRRVCTDRRAAQQHADMENMASDFNSYRVVEV